MSSEKLKLLIVEDQRVNRSIIKKILSPDYEIIEAEDGEPGIQLLKENKDVSVILLDIVMPKMNGYEFMEHMKEMRKDNIPVIVMTSDQEGNAEVNALRAGAIDFITKPIVPEVLVNRVRNAVIRNQMVLLDRLRVQAEYDSLTGLYNRSKLFSKIMKMQEENPDKVFSFTRFDVDNFRLYNTAMGEAAGDQLLCYIAKELSKMASDLEYKVYGRIDADVFCLFQLYEKDVQEKQIEFASQMMRNYREDYVIDTSFGIYVVDEPGLNPEIMLTKASMATDKCKHMYEQNFAYYDKAMEKAVSEELEVTNEMQGALQKEQFHVYLQPKYDLNTDRPCGAEALVRWLHPEKGLISPGKFIPVFEKNGFIARLDYYMWEHVCALLGKWKKQGLQLYSVSVNMSRVSMYNPHVADLMMELVQRYDVEPEYLNLEITESAYMSNPDLMKETIASLQENGFKILMDDFGSGYSSLNTLKEINVDILKIDMKFLPNGKDNGRSEKILSSIVRMSGWLGMPVIAEGVETKEQKEFLESIGCGYVQGFYYAKPMPVEDYEQLVSQKAAVKMNRSEENDSQLQSVWSSDVQIEEIMRGISVPLSIFEYSESTTEIVRVNQAYIDTFGMREHRSLREELELSDYQKISQAFAQAAQTGEAENCLISFITRDGSCKWFRVRIKRLGQIPKSCILCSVFVDVTSEILYESELTRIESMFAKEEKSKLLVVDDQEMSRAIIHQMFAGRYDILEAENGARGIELLKKNKEKVAIVLLDMIMPEMDGKAFLEVKNKNPDIKDIPVVVISAEEDSAIQLGMLKMGANDYITKPFEMEIVKQRIKNVMDYNSRFHILLEEYRKDIGQ